MAATNGATVSLRSPAMLMRPAYVDYYRKQIVELCSNYGELFEFWCDGANGGEGYYGGARETRKIDAPAYYNWPSIVALVHRHQPKACVFEPLGADLRWVGNEAGVAARSGGRRRRTCRFGRADSIRGRGRQREESETAARYL